MAKTLRRHRTGRASNEGGQAAVALAASVAAMRWRLEEAACRIQEAADALERGHSERACQRLLDLEPLVHEAERVLAAALILIGDEPCSPLVEPRAER